MKVCSIKKGASMPRTELNPYGVGLMRLREMAIAVKNFSESDIEYIGFCSIHRIEVVLCKVGNNWGVWGRMDIQLLQFENQFGYRGHIRAYWVIYGKRVKALRPQFKGTAEELMRAYNSRGNSKPLSKMSAMEIFMAAKEQRPSRRYAPKMTSNERIASAAKMEKL